jgi:hypothetical protein
MSTSEIMELLSHYMQASFLSKLHGQASEVKPSIHLSLPLLFECERITTMLVKAFNNKCEFILSYTSNDNGINDFQML